MIIAQDLGVPTLNGYSGNFPPNHAWPSPCLHPNKRLLDYLQFDTVSKWSLTELAAKVVLMSSQTCSERPPIPTLLIDSAQIEERQLKVKLTIFNSGAFLFESKQAGDDVPIRLSWRYVPASINVDRGDSIPGWDTRKDLDLVVGPGARHSELLILDLPSKPGQYNLQISLVKDGKYWFHNVGLIVPELPITVP